MNQKRQKQKKFLERVPKKPLRGVFRYIKFDEIQSFIIDKI